MTESTAAAPAADQGPTPTIGRIVHYTMSEDDAVQINRRRSHTKAHIQEHIEAATGVQVHVGNDVREGGVYPMMITAVWGSGPDAYVNGQVHLDGNDLYWATSVKAGTGPRTYAWPPRA